MGTYSVFSSLLCSRFSAQHKRRYGGLNDRSTRRREDYRLHKFDGLTKSAAAMTPKRQRSSPSTTWTTSDLWTGRRYKRETGPGHFAPEQLLAACRHNTTPTAPIAERGILIMSPSSASTHCIDAVIVPHEPGARPRRAVSRLIHAA